MLRGMNIYFYKKKLNQKKDFDLPSPFSPMILPEHNIFLFSFFLAPSYCIRIIFCVDLCEQLKSANCMGNCRNNRGKIALMVMGVDGCLDSKGLNLRIFMDKPKTRQKLYTTF